jgi:hypothetical protein
MTPNVRGLSRTLFALALAGCASNPAPAVAPAPPAVIIGEFVDDYGERHTVTTSQWLQRPRNRFHIVKWNPDARYLIARNDTANVADRGLWTRIDWVPLSGMQPYEVAFCFSAYKAPSAAAAESVTVAKPETPRTGCNGFPFTRLRRPPAR